MPLVAGLVLVCASTVSVLAGAGECLVPRWVRPKPMHTRWQQGWHKNLIVLKCSEGSGVRLRDGLLVSLNSTSVQELQQVLSAHGQPAVRRLFSRPESVLDQDRTSGQLLSGRELADLNLYYLLTPAPAIDPELLVDDLNALAVVELCYFEPMVQQGAIHQDLSGPPANPVAGSATPDFSGRQDYLQPPPLGMDAVSAWDVPGGLGQGVRLGVVERGLNPHHEDLPVPETWAGNTVDLDHGTSVLGEILGRHNGFGVMGISPDAELHVSIFETEPPYPVIADALNALKNRLHFGDVLLIEYHARGPASGEACLCSCQSFEYVPLEYWQANFDVIASLSANQVVCVEIAGNGSMDLDHQRYWGAFDRGTRDSGAILVGAAEFGTRKPACWSNFGSRLDLHGQGVGIVTTGYGWLYDGGQNATYTAGFGGTSAAGAMIAGAVCAFQGWYKARTGDAMPPEVLLERLRQSGLPQGQDARQIGPFPDLYSAIYGPVPTFSARQYADVP